MAEPEPRPAPRTAGSSVAALILVEFLTSCGTNFLQVGIFFYTAHRLGWGLRANFLLATGQGLFYIAGALAAHRLSGRVAPRAALAAIYLAMSLIALCGARFPYSATLAVLLIAYATCSSLGWPILESLVSTGVEGRALSRRISIYNVTWSGAGAIVLAVNGALIETWPSGVFLLPVLLHAAGAAVMFTLWRRRVAASTRPPPRQPIISPTLQPEPELVAVRTVALWLSRVALPATYIVIYSLAALMPSLPVMRVLSETHKTLLGSTWMAARWATFLILGLGAWWHSRPRVLLAAAALMLISFAGVVVRPSELFISASTRADLFSMAAWQIGLGSALGMIYSGSLYFGMALSEGSTEHGGYHEALIGLGSVLGPGTGAITQWIRPGDVRFGVAAVGGLVVLSTLAVFATSRAATRHKRKKEASDDCTTRRS